MTPPYPPPPRRVDEIADRLSFVMTVASGAAVVVALWWTRPLWKLVGATSRTSKPRRAAAAGAAQPQG